MIFLLFQNIFSIAVDWLLENLLSIVISLVSLAVGFIIYRIIRSQITKLVEKEKLEKNTGKNITRLIRYFIILTVGTAVIMQFAETIGLITAMLTVVGGTILGFAAMNTLGNAIAGIIIMVSKPFTVGDRILTPDGNMADIIDIKLVYTILRDLDNVKISIPNQKLLTDQIENYGKNTVIRRSVTVTPGFNEDREKVEKVLLEAAKKVPEVLSEPEAYVWINKFQNYAVEYVLFVFINDIENLPRIDSDLHKTVLDECKDNNIDISTPLLMRQLKD